MKSIALLTIAFVCGLIGLPAAFAGQPMNYWIPLVAVFLVAGWLSGKCDTRKGR